MPRSEASLAILLTVAAISTSGCVFMPMRSVDAPKRQPPAPMKEPTALPPEKQEAGEMGEWEDIALLMAPEDVSAEPVASAAPPEQQAIKRFPTFEGPSTVKPRQKFSWDVSLTMTQRNDDTVVTSKGELGSPAKAELALNLPLEEAPWAIKVVLVAPGLIVEEASRKGRIITLPREGDSDNAQFTLHAPHEVGEYPVLATFWRGSLLLGHAKRTLRVQRAGVAAASAAQPQDTQAEVEAIPVQPQLASELPNVTVMFVRGGENRRHISTIVITDQGRVERTDYEMLGDLNDKISSLLKGLPDRVIRSVGTLDTPDSQPFNRSENLEQARAVGKELHTLKILRAVTKVIEEERFRRRRPVTIQILTDEDFIPWELLSYEAADKKWEYFIGLKNPVARWHLTRNAGMDMDIQRRSVLKVTSLVSVMPTYSDNSLPSQGKDLALVPKKLLREVGGTFADLQLAMTNPQLPMGILHFSGHGEVQGKPPALDFALVLNNASLASKDWPMLVPKTWVEPPLIFFNACSMGRALEADGVLLGWPDAVLRSGASGYIGGLWPVGDLAASTFAQKFYTRVIARDSVAEALRKARRDFLVTGDPTYLAYVYYGDVGLHLEFPDVEPAPVPAPPVSEEEQEAGEKEE
jgi:hypothetical protein